MPVSGRIFSCRPGPWVLRPVQEGSGERRILTLCRKRDPPLPCEGSLFCAAPALLPVSPAGDTVYNAANSSPHTPVPAPRTWPVFSCGRLVHGSGGGGHMLGSVSPACG